MTSLTHISLCSGIGGDSFAATCAGFKTLAHCEIREFQRGILRRHFPEAVMWNDIRNVTANTAQNVLSSSRPLDLLTAGFPCQPYSLAGKLRGHDDDRDLWPEVARIIELLHPRWFVGENVANFAGMGLSCAITDLEKLGYDVGCFIIPACAVGAPHRRDRLFIVANAVCIGLEEKECISTRDETPQSVFSRDYATHSQCEWGGGELSRIAEYAMGYPAGYSVPICSPTDPDSITKCETHSPPDSDGGTRSSWSPDPSWFRFVVPRAAWAAPPSALHRVDDGLSRKVDNMRLEALGNAIVPAQMYPITRCIADILEMEGALCNRS